MFLNTENKKKKVPANICMFIWSSEVYYISLGQPAGSSNTTTVPGDVSSPAVTPPPNKKVKRSGSKNLSKSKSDVDKAPRPPRADPKVQSQELKEMDAEPSPGTPYYSPPKDPGQALDRKPKNPKSKGTAVKAKPKPNPKKPAKDRKTRTQEAPEPQIKPEELEETTAEAVQDALRRGGTADLPPTPSSSNKNTNKKKKKASPQKKKQKASPQKKTASPEKKKKTASPQKKKKQKASPQKPAKVQDSDSSDSGSEEEGDDGSEDRELSLQQVQAKKAAHARYMRFSRSVKSKRALPAYLA